MDYGNNKQKKIISSQQSVKYIPVETSKDIVDNNQWRGSCQINKQKISTKQEQQQQSYRSYRVNIFSSYFRSIIFSFVMFFKIRGEDDKLYTIQMINIDKSKLSQTRQSLTPNRSSVSIILHDKEKNKNSLKSSLPKLQTSIDTKSRLSTI